MPKVSVIVPVYKAERYIERCARSLFEQTLDDIEFIFIDDCSPDNSIEILKSILTDYPNRETQVIIHRMEANCGQAKVREWGIRNAKGDYTIHCDSDDSVDITAYKLLYDKAIEGDFDMVFHDYYICQGQNKQYKTSGVFGKNKNEQVSSILSGKMKASLCMTLIRKSLYENERFTFPKGDMTEDSTTILQVLALTDKIAHLGSGLYNYYTNEHSITNVVSSNNCLKKFQNCVDNTTLLEAFYREFPYPLCDAFDLRKLDNINQLLPIIHEKEYLNLWRHTYPSLTKRLLRTNLLTKREKLKVVLVYCGLYSFYYRLKGYKSTE